MSLFFVSSSSERDVHCTHGIEVYGLPTGFQKHNSEAKQQGFPCRIFELIMFENKNVNISTTRNSQSCFKLDTPTLSYSSRSLVFSIVTIP